ARPVVHPPRVQPPLAPLHLTVQVVARELADDITPQVDLLEMAAPVVQVPQRPPREQQNPHDHLLLTHSQPAS
ncbi:hypothetical protein QVH83_004623, partial [Salmonella enterica]|nr:hypothetical protein [Salmonella enterica]